MTEWINEWSAKEQKRNYVTKVKKTELIQYD